MPNDIYWMQQALIQAQLAAAAQEVPVGAVLVQDNQLIAFGYNLSIQNNDPSAHAEMVVLRRAGEVLKNYRLLKTTLYVTLEPCIMCTGLLVHARIERLVFGAFDPKAGAICSICQLLDINQLNHTIQVTQGVLEEPCGQILSDFFKSRRKSYLRLDQTVQKQ
jgi:tRNA(adenine34) deaminase